ncbi:hypothetical protein VCRA2126O85_10282 [Vibrio crassostreae]|nr:hypothetical protein VCRA2128O100_10282 [Vibrio crassostreae]CAK2716095.1 hypothetical protein VCRA2128O106_10282 [Vibrio crassostreae]CAK2717182.1 hypothetical protein VCRA2125O83_10282 [Vibrio crassostreae]CAK2720437.1 hypothetical protein VCRA2126O86_10282 [Vibrio crassostreae]CAK2723900.1 hypothetical protein VCRA2126O85_10282 [Vibrio crassostreae]
MMIMAFTVFRLSNVQRDWMGLALTQQCMDMIDIGLARFPAQIRLGY